MENSLYSNLISEIKQINTDELTDVVDKNPVVDVIESQKVYFWTRIYLKDEEVNIEIGDNVIIKYTPSGESLMTKFMCFGKKGVNKDYTEQIINYNAEDDKKILCLMIDEKMVNYNDEIPFIRTLFKTGRHFEYQIVKRTELQFVVEKNQVLLDYYDTDF
jgi:hypothetical protein